MKLLYLCFLILIFSCESDRSKLEEVAIECPQFDSISFERSIWLDDRDLEIFLRPIHWIDSIILAHNIIPDTIMRPYLYDTLYIESWTFNQQRVKIRERKTDSQFTPEIESSLQFYILTNCNWYHVNERTRIKPDTLIDMQILNFNKNDYVNYIYARGPNPIRGFTSKSPKTHPMLNIYQLMGKYIGLQKEIEYHNSH